MRSCSRSNNASTNEMIILLVAYGPPTLVHARMWAIQYKIILIEFFQPALKFVPTIHDHLVLDQIHFCVLNEWLF